MTRRSPGSVRYVDIRTLSQARTMFSLTGTQFSTKQLVAPYIQKPCGYSLFAHEIVPVPQRWAAMTCNLVSFNEHSQGGHFAVRVLKNGLAKHSSDVLTGHGTTKGASGRYRKLCSESPPRDLIFERLSVRAQAPHKGKNAKDCSQSRIDIDAIRLFAAASLDQLANTALKKVKVAID